MNLRSLLGNRWRRQEWLLFFVAAVGLVSLVRLSGGDTPWWGSILAGFGLGVLIDVAERMGRRRAESITILTREELD